MNTVLCSLFSVHAPYLLAWLLTEDNVYRCWLASIPAVCSCHLKCCINQAPHNRLACAHSGKGVVMAVDYMEEWTEHETERETGSGGTDGIRALKEFVGNLAENLK